MEKEFKDIEIFDGKNLSELFKNIYDNSDSKKNKIDELIDQLQPFITDMDSALIMVPIIKDYLDVSVKNDDQLNKLGAIITRMLTVNKGQDSIDDANILLSEYDKRMITEAVNEEKNIKNKLDELEKEKEEWTTDDSGWETDAKTKKE